MRRIITSLALLAFLPLSCQTDNNSNCSEGQRDLYPKLPDVTYCVDERAK